MADDDARLSSLRRSHMGRALARARWTFEAQFDERIRGRGFADYRPSDVTIISRLPLEGARVTELSDRAGITKQAVGKLVKGLEERGYVTKQVDPEDGRAQRVCLSPTGRRLLEAALEEVRAIEDEWTELLGASGLSRLRNALFKVSDAFGAPEYL